jgi:hypothetical protein
LWQLLVLRAMQQELACFLETAAAVCHLTLWCIMEAASAVAMFGVVAGTAFLLAEAEVMLSCCSRFVH